MSKRQTHKQTQTPSMLDPDKYLVGPDPAKYAAELNKSGVVLTTAGMVSNYPAVATFVPVDAGPVLLPLSSGTTPNTPPELRRCAPMKKTDIARRLLNRHESKGTRARDVDQKLAECNLRFEGNGRWSIVLDPAVLSPDQIERLTMPNWPPTPTIR